MRLLPALALLASLTACDEIEALTDLDAATLDARPQPQDAAADAVALDAEVALDAQVPDAAVEPDAAVGPDPCGLALDPDPDRPRVVLVGHRFSDELGVPGTSLAAYPLSADGHVGPEAARLDLGDVPVRVRFLPSGAYALALTENGTLHVIAVSGADGIEIVRTLPLPGAAWTELYVDDDGAFAHLIQRDVTEAAGVFTVALGCGAEPSLLDTHLGLRLAQALAVFPGAPDRALLLGGQAVFDPVDPDDTRLLARGEDGGWREVAAFDLWGDHVDATGVAISPDGATLLVPNGSGLSDEGGQVMAVAIDGDTLEAEARFVDQFDARRAVFHPNGTGLVTRTEPGRITVFTDGPDGYEPTDALAYGLPEDLALITRGRLNGLVVIPAVSPREGSQLVTVQIEEVGVVREVHVTALPEGGAAIPGTVAVSP